MTNENDYGGILRNSQMFADLNKSIGKDLEKLTSKLPHYVYYVPSRDVARTMIEAIYPLTSSLRDEIQSYKYD